MTDELYRQWIQTLPCCLDGRSYSEFLEHLGEWRNPACHVRRAGESGTGYKAEFCTIPLTHIHHAYQHQYGELACLAKFSRDPELLRALKNASPREAERIAKDWFDAQVEKYRKRWMTETPEGREWAKRQSVGVTA